MNIESLTSEGRKIERRLMDLGVIRETRSLEARPEEATTAFGVGYPMKAMEKFLGYYDNSLKIAFNPSISISTDFSYCLSACRYIARGSNDRVFLDGEESQLYLERAKHALDYVRNAYGLSGSFHFYIRRYRKYTDAKGMSESASVATSVAMAMSMLLFQSEADESIISELARFVSGSGTRGIFRGTAFWLSYPGISHRMCHAARVADFPKGLKYGIFPKSSSVMTSSAHRIAVASGFYSSWVKSKYPVLNDLLDSSFETSMLLARGQQEMYNLNAIMLSGSVFLQTSESLKLIRALQEFQKSNEGIFLTGDTGPSIMVASLDGSLIREFASSVEDVYLPGGQDFSQHNKSNIAFRSEAESVLNDMARNVQ
jgi:diphosphomevalonate decarboxylase